MDIETTTPPPEKENTPPFDQVSLELAGLLESRKTGEQTGKKPAAKAPVAATDKEAGAHDPDETKGKNHDADADPVDSTDAQYSAPAYTDEEQPEAGTADKSKLQKQIDTQTAQTKDPQGQLTAALVIIMSRIRNSKLVLAKKSGVRPERKSAETPPDAANSYLVYNGQLPRNSRFTW
jgi:hypothetical protein